MTSISNALSFHVHVWWESSAFHSRRWRRSKSADVSLTWRLRLSIRLWMSILMNNWLLLTLSSSPEVSWAKEITPEKLAWKHFAEEGASLFGFTACFYTSSLRFSYIFSTLLSTHPLLHIFCLRLSLIPTSCTPPFVSLHSFTPLLFLSFLLLFSM